MRTLLEQGFEVAVVKDATAGAKHPDWGDGYQAALVNFGYMANAVLTTERPYQPLRNVLNNSRKQMLLYSVLTKAMIGGILRFWNKPVA